MASNSIKQNARPKSVVISNDWKYMYIKIQIAVDVPSRSETSTAGTSSWCCVGGTVLYRIRP